MREYYEKLPDGTFSPVGIQFSGFPANGIWRVVDGSQNCIIKLSDNPNLPVPHLDVALLSLTDDIIRNMPSRLNIYDIVSHVLLAVAKTQPKTYPELFL